MTTLEAYVGLDGTRGNASTIAVAPVGVRSTHSDALGRADTCGRPIEETTIRARQRARWVSAATATLVALPFLVALLFAAPAARADHADPLRLQWHLDERTNLGGDAGYATPDSSGHGLYGYNSQGTKLVPGRFANAFQFFQPAGSTQKGVTAFSSLFEPQKISLIAWVRANSYPGDSRYVAGKGGGGCAPASYAMYTLYGNLYFYVRSGTTAFHAPGAASAAVFDGGWHMVTGTYDGATARFYVDGTEVGSGTAVPGPIQYRLQTNELMIGGYPGANSCAPIETDFRGDIDEVSLYSRALTPPELAGLTAAPGSVPPPAIDSPSRPDVPGPGPADGVGELELTVSPTTFRAFHLHGSVIPDSRERKKYTRHGTRVEFTLGDTGGMEFTVESLRPGKRVRGNCTLKPSNQGAKNCTRIVKERGSFLVPGKEGSNSFHFSGRWRSAASPSRGTGKEREPLAAGRYFLVGEAMVWEAHGGGGPSLEPTGQVKRAFFEVR